MRLIHISDAHGQHTALKLPEADIIVHSGDFTFGGSEQEAMAFLNWICDLPYRHKVFVASITTIAYVKPVWTVCLMMCTISVHFVCH